MYRYVYYFCVYTKPHPQALALRIYERLDAMGKKPVNKKPAAKMSGKPEAASSSTLKAASSQSPQKATAAKALSPQQDTPETINSSPDKAFVKRELRLQAWLSRWRQSRASFGSVLISARLSPRSSARRNTSSCWRSAPASTRSSPSCCPRTKAASNSICS